jgi:hypothetical protein
VNPNRLIPVCVLAGSFFAVLSAAAAPTKKECMAAINRGDELRLAGKFVEARERYGVCVSTSCASNVRDDCTKRLGQAIQATPTIVFEAKDGAGNDLSAVRVTMDDQTLTDKLDGTAIPMDLGEHRFTFEAEGVPKAEKTIVVREGDKDRHERVVLGVASAAVPGTVASTATASPPDGSSQRTIGLVLGGAGIVTLIIGTVLRFAANSAYNGVLGSDCNGSPNSCNSKATSDEQSADTQAKVSTIGFIGGFTLLAGGAVLYVTAPKAGGIGVAPTAGTGGAGLTLQGVW